MCRCYKEWFGGCVDEKGKEQEMCVPAESSGTSPTFEWCGLYKKKKEAGSNLGET
jgi:hypothetical protein